MMKILADRKIRDELNLVIYKSDEFLVTDEIPE